MIRLKRGVALSGLQPQMILAVMAAQSLFREEFGADLIITSVCDGPHEHVLHYVGQAVDLRTKHLIPGDRIRLAPALQSMLGDQFDVILEDDHLHVEYDPR